MMCSELGLHSIALAAAARLGDTGGGAPVLRVYRACDKDRVLRIDSIIGCVFSVALSNLVA
jgi:hypothetical protein